MDEDGATPERQAWLDLDPARPRRFRWPAGRAHPNGTAARWRYGCYFPLTDLVVADMGERGTGVPRAEGLEWVDDPPPPETFGPAARTPTRDGPAMGEMLGRPEGL